MDDDPIYSGFIRQRVAGILEEEGKLLLVKLLSPVSNQEIWIPPGGGVEFGESCHQALIREFAEETSLQISVGELLHINELISGQFHVIEHFFKVKKVSGSPKLGIDPEHPNDQQLLSDIGFFSREQIKKLNCKPDYLKTTYWDKSASVSFNSQR